MFKPFLLSPNYQFDLLGRCQINGEILDTVTGFFDIEINGQIYKLEKQWLSLVAHYEIELTWDDLLKVQFFPCKSKVIKLHCGYTVLFKKPIVFKHGFFFIPGYSRFAINRNSDIISVKTGRKLKSGINSYGYPYVNVYDPDKNRWRSVATHILFAKTFVSNKDPSSLFFVNHLNGNKLDLHPKNLEWVTSVRNNTHAVETNLRKDNKPCKMRDINSLIVSHFPSVSSCLQTLGFKRSNGNILKNLNGERIPHLFLGRFEIKYIDDSSDWFFTKENKDIIRYLNTGPYQAFNVVTKECFEAVSIRELAKKTSLSQDQISSALKQLKPKTYDNFLIRKKSSDLWPTEYKSSVFYQPRKFILKNTLTGQIVYTESLKKAIAFLGIDKRTFKLRLKKQQQYENWEIVEK